MAKSKIKAALEKVAAASTIVALQAAVKDLTPGQRNKITHEVMLATDRITGK